MRERKTARTDKAMDSISSRTPRHRVSTSNWDERLVTATYLYGYDGGTWSYGNYISGAELTNSLAIIFISASAVGIGVGQLFAQAAGY